MFIEIYSWLIGVNNGGGWGRDPRFWEGVVGSPWKNVLCYYVQTNKMRTLSKFVTYQKWNDLCMLNKNSGNDALNHMLRASANWTSRTDGPQFQTRTNEATIPVHADWLRHYMTYPTYSPKPHPLLSLHNSFTPNWKQCNKSYLDFVLFSLPPSPSQLQTP